MVQFVRSGHSTCEAKRKKDNLTSSGGYQKKRSKINIIFVFECRESIDSKLGKNDIGVVVI